MISRFISAVCAVIYLCADTSYAQSPAPDISKLIQFTFEKLENTQDNCDASLKRAKIACGNQYIYPVLSGHPDPAIQDRINEHILGLAPVSADDSIRVEAATEIQYNENNFLSLSHSSDAYGVRPSDTATHLTCSNIDLQSGEQISLKQVLKPGFDSALPRLIRKNLDTTLKTRIPGYIASSIRARNGDWKLEPNQPFYLNGRVLVLCFDQFVLSDQSTAALQIPLPYDLIKRQIDNKRPIGTAPKLAKVQPVETDEPNEPDERDSINFRPDGPVTSQNTDFSYLCSTADLSRQITVVENGPNAQYICHVESITNDKVKVLWRSQQDRKFCHQKASELVERYKTEWKWACEKKS